MCAPGFAVSVIGSPGFSNVLVSGACSKIRLLITLESVVVVALVRDGSVVFKMDLIALARGGSVAFMMDLVIVVCLATLNHLFTTSSSTRALIVFISCLWQLYCYFYTAFLRVQYSRFDLL